MPRRLSSKSEREEGGSYLASVSDLMSALMFIFIIALSVFVLSFKQQQERLTGTADERTRLLNLIKQRLTEQGETRIEIDADNGVIRFGEAILFDSGRAEVKQEGQVAVERLRLVLESVLPCYSRAAVTMECGQDGTRGKVDAVFVEGHTDSQPIRAGSGRFEDNWDLSASRARNVFQRLLPEDGNLSALRNLGLAQKQNYRVGRIV
jgi:flagellar motor protein MotB